MGKNDVPEETFKAADHLSQESADHRHRRRARGQARQERLRAHGQRGWTWSRRRTTTRSRRRSTASTTCSIAGISGFAPSGRPRSCACATKIINAVRDFFNNQGFILADTPIFTPAACEGTTTLFPVQYFEDTTAFLTQSGQLYNEANAMALGKVYCIRPDLPRREEQDAAASHRVLDGRARDGVRGSRTTSLRSPKGWSSSVVARVLDRAPAELKMLERDTSKLEAVKAPFPRIHYDEAAKILHDKGVPFQVGGDLGGTDETVLSEQFDRPVCVTHYPAAIKAFYMKPDPAQPDRALCVDVLAPEGYGEIIGGGQRLDDYDLLVQRIKEHKLPMEAFEWYLDLRRYGSVPHGGFGMGIERCVTWICGLEHVRETIPYPRMLYRHVSVRRQCGVRSARCEVACDVPFELGTLNFEPWIC